MEEDKNAEGFYLKSLEKETSQKAGAQMGEYILILRNRKIGKPWAEIMWFRTDISGDIF